jgi:quercetin dioxygenase-like cupin family protein
MLPVADDSTDAAVTRRTLLHQMLTCMCLPAVAVAQAQSAGRKIVFQHDLPDLALKNWSVTAVEVSYAPGESSSAHRHPGLTMAYVLEGEIRSKVGDDPEKSYTAGQMFLETPGQLHAVSRNASATQPARLLAILLAEKGAQLTTPAK